MIRFTSEMYFRVIIRQFGKRPNCLLADYFGYLESAVSSVAVPEVTSAAVAIFNKS
jgi:hypothetical protein